LFPTTGQFRIKIDAELMLVTAVSGTTFTVTRGIEGSTAASHANGATVTHILTAGALGAQTSDTMPLSEVGGRLTLTTAVPVTTSDVTSASTLYFTPSYRGNRIALYDGTIWKMYGASEVSFTLTGLTADKIYDVFLYDNSGTLTIELSAAWSTNTTRTDDLGLQDGVPVKSGSPTRRWLGTIRTITSTTTEDSASKRYVWNYYNQVRRVLSRVSPTGSWSYATPNGVYRQVNTTTANRFQYVTGDPSTLLDAEASAHCTTSGVLQTFATGIGIDSTSVNSAQTFGDWTDSTMINTDHAHYRGYPGLGFHNINWLETGQATLTHTFYGSGAGGPNQPGMLGEILG
jgi:hypothetical protein